MKAEFSEFTYGFSLVNELTKALSLKAVPIFPSLREEGKEGGGYDAKLLYKRGKILNLQFKLSDWMTARNALEKRIPGHSLSSRYHRFEITNRRISRQHELLLSLEDDEPMTFYAAPAFHRNYQINMHWRYGSVIRNSVFVKPRSIGKLDFNTHRVCFDTASIARQRAYLFSEPREIEVLPFPRFSEFVIAEVAQETDTLETSITRLLKRYASTINSLRHQKWIDRSWRSANSEERSLDRILEELLSEPVDEHDLLRRIARVTSGVFGAQAIAVVKECSRQT